MCGGGVEQCLCLCSVDGRLSTNKQHAPGHTSTHIHIQTTPMNAHMQGHAPLPHEHEQVLHLLEVPFQQLQAPVRLPVVLAVPAELVAVCGVGDWGGYCCGVVWGVCEWVDRPYFYWYIYIYMNDDRN